MIADRTLHDTRSTNFIFIGGVDVIEQCLRASSNARWGFDKLGELIRCKQLIGKMFGVRVKSLAPFFEI